MIESDIKEKYDQHVNLQQYLSKFNNIDKIDKIELIYDLQAGTYIQKLQNPSHYAHVRNYANELGKIISSLNCNFDSILEAGVGEATTLKFLLDNFNRAFKSFGFDLCWSRIKCGREFLNTYGYNDTFLCVGDLTHIPFATNSIDIVYTSHAIEPCSGYEDTILQELYRVTKQYLILLEPAYDLASPEAKKRMKDYDYTTNLIDVINNANYNIVVHKLFPYCQNSLNPTGLTVIKKHSNVKANFTLACPKHQTEITKINNCYYSPAALSVYPIILDIPCLRLKDACLASYYERFIK